MSRLLALFTVLTVLTPLVEVTAGEAPPRSDEVASALADLQRDPGGAGADVVSRLHALGPEALPALLEALANVGPETATARAVAAAIRKHGPAKFEAALRQRLGREPDLGTRLGALRAVGRVSGEEGLPLAVEIVSGMDPIGLAAGRTQSAWRNALRGMVGAGASRMAITLAVSRLPQALETATSRVLADVGRPETVAGLIDLLTGNPAKPATLLQDLARAPILVLARFDVEKMLHHHLAEGDAPTRRAAISAAADVGLRSLVPDLIYELAGENQRIRKAAHAALRKLTGTTQGSRPEAWRTWLETEQEWLRESGLSERLLSWDPQVLARALRDVATHPHVSAALFQEVADLAHHCHPGVRLGAMGALRAMNHPETAPVFVAALRDESPPVRAVAHQALVALTGERLDAEPAGWEQLLAGERPGKAPPR